MVIHTKEKAKIHAHEPKGAKIKGSNIYTVERGPKVHDAKANEMDKKASAKLKAGKKKVTVKIKKASVSGYQIKYASNKNFKKAKTRNTRKTIYTIKSLRSKKKCYVKVRAYKVVKGKKIYGSYSKVLKVTVK